MNLITGFSNVYSIFLQESTKSHKLRHQNTEKVNISCDNFICLLQKFEVVKTESGFLLNKIHQNHSQPKCKNFKCWLKQFDIVPKSYGYELKKSNAISQNFDDLSSSELSERVSNKNIAIKTTNIPISSRDFKKHLNTDNPSYNPRSGPHTISDYTDENSQYYDLYDILE